MKKNYNFSLLDFNHPNRITSSLIIGIKNNKYNITEIVTPYL